MKTFARPSPWSLPEANRVLQDFTSACCRWLAVFLTCASSFSLLAQIQAPVEVGTTVNGFQDDFSGTALNTNWVVAGSDVFSVSDGMLHVSTAAGDPNHLLYELPGYDNTVQEVLARIRIRSFGSGDASRGGIGVAVDPGSSQGINYLFRNVNSEGQTGNHMAFLNDLVAWGPGQNFVWQTNTWYWVRLRQEPNAVSQGSANDVFGKIWPADGSAAEPSTWQLGWDYTPSPPTRTGYAGITAGSSSGLAELDVDYILIKAAGLPPVFVAPSAFVQLPVSITNQPQNQTVMESMPASFSVGVIGTAPTFQWYKNSTAIPGATAASYTIPAAAYADNGALFSVVAQNSVSNKNYTATSRTATLTVLADTNPPVLLDALALGLSQVQATFSERVSPGTAANLANYSLVGTNGPLAITSAVLDVSQTNVLLAVSGMVEGAAYTMTVNHVTDQSARANAIAPDSQAQFTASTYAPTAIGAPAPGARQVIAGNGYDISAGGAGLGGTNDQCQFSWQLRSGDFDVKVRLDSLGLADAWSQAGLMMREDLGPGARSAAVLATPSISGAFFETRSATNGATTIAGSFPVNYPNTWLRLKRAGNDFTGYGSLDGLNWTQLGTLNLGLPTKLYLGFVVSSGNTNGVATAAFRDFSPVTVAGVAGPLAFETLGESSRRTSLVISEIMYHPTNSGLAYVELFNTRAEPQELSGYRLGGSIDFTFPTGTTLAGGGFVVVAGTPAELESLYGLGGVYGPYSGHLPNDSGTVQLWSQGGALLLEVDYSDQPPWPVAADGAGHSLVLARPSYGEGNPAAWAASDMVGGSPGKLDPHIPDPLRQVVINEFLAHTDDPAVDYIELYNHSAQAIDISGCTLSDHPIANRYVIPAGTILPAGGFVVFTQADLGFALSAAGETIYLKNPAGSRVLDVVRFEGQENGIAMGRYPDGGERFYRLAAQTPGGPNSGIRAEDVVINEIMYAPVSLNGDDQYVELYNSGAHSVDLSGWQFVSGIGYTFAAGTVLPPDGYLVVARNAARLRSLYPNLNSGNLVGNFSGKLSGSGERLALAKPDTIVSTNASGLVQTNIISIVVNEVPYSSGGRWGQWSDAGGSSLELVDPHADGRLGANWADSDETHKAPWTIVSATGTIDNGDVAADELQALLEGPGEALIDDVQVLTPAGANLVANATFESGASGWTAEGTEKFSGLETTEGHTGSQSYHLRAVEKGDNQINRVRTPLKSTLVAGTTNVTIRAALRWLKGDPDILLRLRGNWLECAAELTTPSNPGTPGARNSRYVGNAPPAIAGVKHSPVLPQAGQGIVVSAQVTDPDGVGPVVLEYRLDPATTYTALRMNDSGTNGDSVAGDGVFSATIPGQAAGTMLAFYIQAADKASTAAAGTFPEDAPTRECLVRVGESQPTGNFPVYRLWVTQANLNTWNANPRLDNSLYDATFVLGDQRVIYNAGGKFKGSPYISPGYCGPTCGRCGYAFAFPSDDPLLGEEELVLDWPGGHGGETTALQEQMCYWIADRLNLPWSHRYTIRLHINGITDTSRQATFEAVVQPAGGFLKEWSPGDSGGDFFKIERAFEFNDSGSLVADPEPRLQLYTTTGGVKKREKYRWNWMFRSTDRRNNYTNLFALVDAVNAPQPEPYSSGILGTVDIEEWMGIFATEHIIVNFDAYGHDIGKNMYAFRPDNGKWQLYMFDLDWAMLAGSPRSGSYAASTATLFNAEDPTITRMFAFPPFARAYWRTVQNALAGPMDPTNYIPVIDAKSGSLLANRIAWCDGQPLTGPAALKTWFAQRRTYLQSQFAKVAAPFTIKSVVVTNAAALVSGTAPIAAQTVLFDGVPFPVAWTTVSNWTATVALRPGTNQFSVTGVDPRGQPVPGTSTNLTIEYQGGGTGASLTVCINEWMAGNTHTLANPVGGKFSDWFEIYNYGPDSADLGGYSLTDDLTNQFQFRIPEGYTIPSHGFLLVWADGKATNGTPDLHVTFKLSKGGEALGLFDPHGAAVDYVTYGPQNDDVSEGRYPDGAAARYFMPIPTPGAHNVISVPPPAIAAGVINSGTQLELSWPTVLGQSYQLEYTEDLAAPLWTPVGGTTAGTGGSLTITTDLNGATHRFYRLSVAP